MAAWSRGMNLASGARGLWFNPAYGPLLLLACNRAVMAAWSRGMILASGARGRWFNPATGRLSFHQISSRVLKCRGLPQLSSLHWASDLQISADSDGVVVKATDVKTIGFRGPGSNPAADLFFIWHFHHFC